MRLSDLLAGAEPLDGGFALSVPADWHQGRTAYGGLSAALALAAAQKVGSDLAPLRSAQVSFVGPLYGRLEVRAEVLRRGRNATWVRAEIRREGEVGLVASFVFMREIESVVSIGERSAPAGVIPAAEAHPVPTERSPLFLQEHFDVRFAVPRIDGPRQADICWWIRLREHGGLDPMVHLLACADALPPAVLAFLPPPTPVSSMTWHCNLLHPVPESRDGWWLLRAQSDFAANGGTSDLIDVWNADGESVMASIQSVALFG